MSIPFGKFESLKSAMFQAGRAKVGSHVHNVLHDEAHNCADETLIAAGMSLFDDDVDNEEVDELIMCYERGFWEQFNKEEVNELKAFISDGIASTKGTSDPRFPDLFVPRVAMLSTSHMRWEDDRTLTVERHPSIISKYDEGCFIRLGEIVVSDIEEDFAGFSIEFRNLLLCLAEAGYSFIRFDCDAAVCPSFPTFDW